MIKTHKEKMLEARIAKLENMLAQKNESKYLDFLNSDSTLSTYYEISTTVGDVYVATDTYVLFGCRPNSQFRDVGWMRCCFNDDLNAIHNYIEKYDVHPYVIVKVNASCKTVDSSVE